MSEFDTTFSDGCDSANRLIEGFERLQLEKVFGTPDMTANYLAITPFEVGDQHLMWLNRLAVGSTVMQAGVMENSLSYVVTDEAEAQRPGNLRSTDILYIPAGHAAASDSMSEVYTAAADTKDPDESGLLLRLGVFLTHRLADGHSRTGAISEALRSHGYDGSDGDKELYTTLTQGRRGIEKAGHLMDVRPLQRQFAHTVLTNTVERHEYDGPVPLSVSPFDINELAASRPDLPQDSGRWIGRMWGEAHFGVTLAAKAATMDGRQMNDYIVKDKRGRTLLDSELLFDHLELFDMLVLETAHEQAKTAFIHEIVLAFRGWSSIFGNAEDVMRSVVPTKFTD